jgi:hypothetical protein
MIYENNENYGVDDMFKINLFDANIQNNSHKK